MVRKNLRSLCDCKRGSFGLDILLFLILLFFVAVIGIALYPALTGINDIIQEDAEIPAQYKAVPDNFTTNYPLWLDEMFLLLFVLAALALWVTAWFIDVYPVFFVVAIIVLVFLTLGGMLLSNAFQDSFVDTDLASDAAAFTIIPFIMGNLGYITIVIGSVTAILLFSKLRGVG